MTPADKAKALLKKCRTVAPYAVSDTIAKRAAIIVCEESAHAADKCQNYEVACLYRDTKRELEKL